MTDALVVKLDGAGTPVSAIRFGGGLHNEGRGIAVDASGGVYVTGHFAGNPQWEDGLGTKVENRPGPAQGASDALVEPGDFYRADS